MANNRKQSRRHSQVFKLKPAVSFMRTALPAGLLFGFATSSYAEVLPNFQSANSSVSRDTSGNHATIKSPTSRPV